MAKPKIFVSSTFYDLRHVREDIGHFIKDQGYETILFEYGEIPYGRYDKPEEYCYAEIELSDILVCIIGGRYGTDSTEGRYSITQKELKHALDLGKQVYIFAEKNVLAEFETYKINKENDNIKFRHADNKKVYEFLEEVYALPRNNSIFGFETSQDIIKYLKEQWSGMFQRLLRNEEENTQFEIVQSLKNTVSTLETMVNLIMDKNENRQAAFEDIILFNHPAFTRIQELLHIRYKAAFTTLVELKALLLSRGYKELSDLTPFDKNFEYIENFYLFEKRNQKSQTILRVTKNIFDENLNLKPHQGELGKGLIIKEEIELPVISDDELPF